MKKNLGSMDRAARSLAALGMLAGAWLLPLSLAGRLGLGATALVVGMTALTGTCLGYRLLGLSTCPTGSR